MCDPNDQAQTSDFIGFSNNEQPQRTNFTPRNYNNPHRHPRPFYQNRQWVNKGQNNRPFNDYSHNMNPSYRPNRNYNPNRNFNNSYHQKAKQDHNTPFDIKQYMHPSFMEDPWQELEAKLSRESTLANN